MSGHRVILYGADNQPAVTEADPTQERMVELCRSFSYKLNAQQYGGNAYESRDFFASEKATCRESEAEDCSLALYTFCRTQVLNSVREYITEIEGRAAARQNQLARRSA